MNIYFNKFIHSWTYDCALWFVQITATRVFLELISQIAQDIHVLNILIIHSSFERFMLSYIGMFACFFSHKVFFGRNLQLFPRFDPEILLTLGKGFN